MRPSNSAPASVSRKASSQGACTSRNSSTLTAITAEIKAMRHRGRRTPAMLAEVPAKVPPRILVRKKTMVAHRIEPAYFTIEAGKPTPNPNLRKARPAAIIVRHSQTRTIVGGHRSPLSSSIGTLLWWWQGMVMTGLGPDGPSKKSGEEVK
jgi:hypothetical protein